MKIKSIHLGDDGLPSSLDVNMTAAEAAFLIRVLGKLNYGETERFQLDGTYDELEQVFVHYYDDGVNSYPTPKPSQIYVKDA